MSAETGRPGLDPAPASAGAPWAREPAGTLVEHSIESRALHGNVLGDPHRRPLWVYLPPTYHRDPGRRFPVIYLVQGMTGQVDMWRNRSAFRANVIELIDSLFATPGMPPCLCVLVDCWTSLGGSQFLDSPGTGRYHTFLCEEVVPAVDDAYRTLASPAHRAITGKSSGGYGAMITPMLRPDLFGAMATHAGDALFELCYLTEFPACVRALREHHDGSFAKFWEDLRSRPPMTRDGDGELVNQYCMAACYSARDDGSVEFPFDVETGELVPAVWARWLERDPVRMVPAHAETLRGLRGIYVDAGRRDEYYLDLGALGFRRALQQIGVTDVFFELFDAGHGAIEYRYPIALEYLARRIS